MAYQSICHYIVKKHVEVYDKKQTINEKRYLWKLLWEM